MLASSLLQKYIISIDSFLEQLTYKLLQNISGKVKKLSKIGQEQKILTSVFVEFLSTSFKNLLMEGRLDTKLCPYANLRYFQYFPIFPNFLRS